METNLSIVFNVHLNSKEIINSGSSTSLKVHINRNSVNINDVAHCYELLIIISYVKHIVIHANGVGV